MGLSFALLGFLEINQINILCYMVMRSFIPHKLYALRDFIPLFLAFLGCWGKDDVHLECDFSGKWVPKLFCYFLDRAFQSFFSCTSELRVFLSLATAHATLELTLFVHLIMFFRSSLHMHIWYSAYRYKTEMVFMTFRFLVFIISFIDWISSMTASLFSLPGKCVSIL